MLSLGLDMVGTNDAARARPAAIAARPGRAGAGQERQPGHRSPQKPVDARKPLIRPWPLSAARAFIASSGHQAGRQHPVARRPCTRAILSMLGAIPSISRQHAGRAETERRMRSAADRTAAGLASRVDVGDRFVVGHGSSVRAPGGFGNQNHRPRVGTVARGLLLVVDLGIFFEPLDEERGQPELLRPLLERGRD